MSNLLKKLETEGSQLKSEPQPLPPLDILESINSQLRSEPQPLPPVDILKSIEESQLSFPQGKIEKYDPLK